MHATPGRKNRHPRCLAQPYHLSACAEHWLCTVNFSAVSCVCRGVSILYQPSTVSLSLPLSKHRHDDNATANTTPKRRRHQIVIMRRVDTYHHSYHSLKISEATRCPHQHESREAGWFRNFKRRCRTCPRRRPSAAGITHTSQHSTIAALLPAPSRTTCPDITLSKVNTELRPQATQPFTRATSVKHQVPYAQHRKERATATNIVENGPRTLCTYSCGFKGHYDGRENTDTTHRNHIR